MIMRKMFELKEQLERAGWELTNESEMYLAVNNIIEWDLVNRGFNSKEILTFSIFYDLVKITNKLTDVYCVNRSRDKVTLYFDSEGKEWERKMKEFVFTMK